MSLYSFFRIFSLILISGLLAYLGDVLGYKLGKKRLSLFSLRPRTTATIIAIFSGIMITLVTLSFASIVSEDVRIAIFNLDSLLSQQKEFLKLNKSLKKNIGKLKSRSDELQNQNEKLQNEINQKIIKVQELENELEQKKENKLVYKADEAIGYRILKENLNDKQLETEFKTLISQIISISKAKGAIPRKFSVIWKESSSQFEKFKEFYKKVSSSDEESLVIMVHCQQNVFKGEKLGKISFTVEKNRIILKKNYIFSIRHFIIDGKSSREEISMFLKYFMNQMKGFLSNKGMVGMEPMPELEFYDYVNYIHELNEPVKVSAYFKKDIHIYEPEFSKMFKLMIEKVQVE